MHAGLSHTRMGFPLSMPTAPIVSRDNVFPQR